MKIALLSAGSDIHTLRWANGLAARGHQVDLITMHPIMPGVHSRVKLHHLPVGPPWGYFLNSKRLNQLLEQIKPEILNAHYATGYGTLARLSGFRPLAISVWGSDVFDFPEKSLWHKKFLTKNLGHADKILSTSQVMANQVRYLLPSVKQVQITPFGVDTHLFSPKEKMTSPNEIVIGTVKKLDYKYGIDLLLRAFAQALSRMKGRPKPSLRLLIAGDGPQRVKLKKLALDLDLKEQVEFQGKIEHSQVPSFLNRMDVFVALSRHESFGVAIIEASACRLPVVVSSAGGLPEVVRDGETGFIVAKDDHLAAAEAILRLVNDPQLRRQLGQKGRRMVKELYDWPRCLEIMEQGLKNVEREP